MDQNKFKLLNYVTPQKVNYKERFGKLTLASINTKVQQKKVPSRFDDYKSLNESLLTDDESDEDDKISNSERQKIIKNIFDSEKSDTKQPVNLINEFSQKLQLDDDDPDATNCSLDRISKNNKFLEDTIDKSSSELFGKSESDYTFSQMQKNICNKTNSNDTIVNQRINKTLEDTIDKTASDVFCKSSDENTFNRFTKNTSNNRKNSDDTVVSRLSTQMDLLGLTENSNLPDDEKVRYSLNLKNQSYSESENSNLKKSNCSIVTISTDSEEDDDDDDESFESATSSSEVVKSPIEILDSSNEVIDSNERYENHVSSNSKSGDQPNTISQTVLRKLGDFFDNMPLKSLSIEQDIENDNHDSSVASYIPETPEISKEMTIGELRMSESCHNESKDSSIDQKNSEIVLSEKTVESKISTPKSQTINSETLKSNGTQISFSTKFHIKIQISELSASSSSSSSSSAASSSPSNSSSSSDISNSKNVESPIKEKTPSPKSKNDTTKIESPKNDKQKNQTPVYEIEEIDEDMEKILNDVYGDKWKTPQILQKFSTRKEKVQSSIQNKIPVPRQPRFSEQIDVTDFTLFHQNINQDLESTRVEPIKTKAMPSSTKAMPSATKAPRQRVIKKSPCKVTTPIPNVGSYRLRERRKAAENVKKIMKLADSDTETSESENDSDESFSISGNDKSDKQKNKSKILYGMESVLIYSSSADCDDDDSKNASSDESYDKENAKISTVKKAFKEYQYTKPSVISSPIGKIIHSPLPPIKSSNTKRKLFNPQMHNYDDYPEYVEEPKRYEPKPNIVVNDLELNLPAILKIPNRNVEILKGQDINFKPKNNQEIFKTPNITPKTKGATPRSNKKNIPSILPTECYGFLQSLDEKVPKAFCDSEALKYRDNFQKNKIELTEKLWNLFNTNVFKFTEEQSIPITWNKKLTNTAGRCMTSKKFGKRTARIELSDKVITNADRLRCTLVHELCHAATWIFNEINGHGKEWKMWGEKAVKIFPELPKIDVCHAYEIEYKYTYKCTICSAKSQAHSKSKKVENIRCAICHGKIEIFLNKRNKEGNIIHTPTKNVTGFAKFVKEQYKTHKKDSIQHKDVMKILGEEYRKLTIEEKKKFI